MLAAASRSRSERCDDHATRPRPRSRRLLRRRSVSRAPDGLLDAALAGIESTRQRPRLLVADRWRPRRLVSRASLGPRVVAVVTVLLLLIALATVLAVIGSSRRPAPPFGLAKPGLIAFDANGDLFASNPDGSGLVGLTSGPEFDILATYAPDGTLIAFESQQPDFSYDVFVMPADGGARVRVIEGLAETGPIAWSPDSRHVAVAARPVGEDGRQIVIGAIDDPGAVRLGGPDVFGSDPAWSPDGRRIAFHRTPCCGEPQDSLWVIDIDGSNAHEVAPNIGDRTGTGYARPHEVEPNIGGRAARMVGGRSAARVPGVGCGRSARRVRRRRRRKEPPQRFEQPRGGERRGLVAGRYAPRVCAEPRPGRQQRVLPGRRCRRLERAPRLRPPVEPGPPDLVARWRPSARHGVRGSERHGLQADQNTVIELDPSGHLPPVTTRISNFGTASYQRLAP